jgi:O-antigen/teichoic acid export membrane protein
MTSEAHHKAAFFRQSGWLMIANVVGGAMMLGVHFLSKKVPEAEYGTTGALLAATILIPAIPLQMVFTREAAAALALGNTRALAGKVRKTAAGLTALWLMFALLVLFMQGGIIEHWKISQPVTLWMFLFVTLGALVTPVFGGLLQGKQDFFWMGWTMMLNAFARVGVAALVIFFITGTAAGFMAGVLAGTAVVLAITMWQTRELWTGPAERFDVGPFLRAVTPLMIGFGACQFLFSVDTVIVGRFFAGEQAGYYTAAGTLSRALMWLVLPLVSVMFPKLVHASAKSEKSNLFGLTLAGTAALGLAGVVGLTVLGPFVVRLVYKPEYVAAATAIIPWYAGAMIPLSLANVLVNNLLAKADFRIVPWLAVLAAAYALTLTQWHPNPRAVLQMMGAFTSLLFAVCAFYTWGPMARTKVAAGS